MDAVWRGGRVIRPLTRIYVRSLVQTSASTAERIYPWSFSQRHTSSFSRMDDKICFTDDEFLQASCSSTHSTAPSSSQRIFTSPAPDLGFHDYNAVKSEPLDSETEQSVSTHRVTVVTFNMLAPCYKRMKHIRGSELKCESEFGDVWQERARRAAEFLDKEVLPQATIVALQEFWLQVSEFFSSIIRMHGHDT